MIKTSKYFRDSVRLSGRENVDCYVMIGGTKVTRHNIKTLKVNYELGNDGIPSIGNCPSQSIELTLYLRDNVPKYPRLDQTVVPYIGFYVFTGSSWRYEYVKMGTFYVPNSDNVTKNDLEISMTCFDDMARMSDENRKRVQIDYNKPEVPTGTIKSVCQYLTRKAGIQFDYSSIEEDVPVTVSPAGWNIRQVLQELAFLQGKNCIVNRDGKFTFVKPREIDFTEFNIKAKNAIKIQYKADLYSTIAAVKCEQLNYTRINDEVDDETHTYEIAEGEMVDFDPDDYDGESPLVDTNVTGVMFHTSTITNEDELLAVYNRCMPYTYYNYELETQGFPQIEIGDIITFVNKDGVERQLLIATHTCVYDGGCKSTFSATGKDSEYVNVEDIEWWDLKDRDPDEDKNKEEKFTEHYFNTGTNYYEKDGVDFEGNYMNVDTTITTKITDENGNETYEYETDYDELVAPQLIKLDPDEHKIHLGRLELNKENKWVLVEVITMEVGSGSGGGNCQCEDKVIELEKELNELKEYVKEHCKPCDCGGGGTTDPVKDCFLKINYIYNTGGQVFEPYEAYYAMGDSYSVISPAKAMYEIDKPTVSGFITQKETEINVIYTYNPSVNDFDIRDILMQGSYSKQDPIYKAFDSLIMRQEYLNTSQVTNAIVSSIRDISASSDGSNNLSRFQITSNITGISPLNVTLNYGTSIVGAADWFKRENAGGLNTTIQKDYTYYETDFLATNINLATNNGRDVNNTTSTNAIPNLFIRFDDSYRDGYTTLRTYNYNGTDLINYWNLSFSIANLAEHIGMSDTEVIPFPNGKTYSESIVTVNYNPSITLPDIYKAYGVVGFNGKYDNNGPVVPTLVLRFDNNLMKFGRITGVTQNGIAVTYTDALRFKYNITLQ